MMMKWDGEEDGHDDIQDNGDSYMMRTINGEEYKDDIQN